MEHVHPTQVAVELPCDTQVAAEVLPAQAQQQHFWSLLRDELCPDTDYSAAGQGVLPHHPPYVPHRVPGQNIPQVDGSTLSFQDQVKKKKGCGPANAADTRNSLIQKTIFTSITTGLTTC